MDFLLTSTDLYCKLDRRNQHRNDLIVELLAYQLYLQLLSIGEVRYDYRHEPSLVESNGIGLLN